MTVMNTMMDKSKYSHGKKLLKSDFSQLYLLNKTNAMVNYIVSVLGPKASHHSNSLEPLCHA
jgi:hypothetical protein